MARKTPRSAKTPPTLVGWKELVDFPDWGLRKVKAKLDTGARTSAVHVQEYALYEQPGQGTMAELHLALDRRRPLKLSIVHARVLRMIDVTNSGGQRETRPLIATRLRLGGVSKLIFLTVTNRSRMLFRVLLGRKAIEGDFLVDVSKKYVTRRR